MYVRPIPEEGQPEMPREGFGYISRGVGIMEPPNYRQCVFYSQDEKDDYFTGDGMWRAGKAMTLLAGGVGGIVMCIVMCTCCVAFQLPTFEGLFWTCMFCFVAQALTFLSWGSDLCDEYECTWSSGTGMNLTAAMLWVWAANMIKSFPEALPPRGRGRRKAPIYDEGEDLNPNRGFEDEYEEGDFENDGEYYDDDYDNYDDQDQYYDDGYDQGEYADEDDGYVDPYADEDDQYETDYAEPDPREDAPKYRQGRDDEFEPNPEFQNSWKGETSVEDESQFDSSANDSDNAFRQSSTDLSNNQAELSQEELEFLGVDDQQSQYDTISELD
jgi:hypothetical protein